MKQADVLLKSVFGYDSFRPLQVDIIQNVLNKKDSLVIMPTGSGKSLCFQLPALLMEGMTVVVSPLIALMEDQVSQLRGMGISAAYLNSTLPANIYEETVNWVRDGRVKLLYAAPETLLKPETLALLAQCCVNCLAIDEAHCISQWGHDFRPEYRQLTAVRQRLPQAACIALTATATLRVRQDILASLSIPQANEFIASFNRENLFLTVQPKIDILGQTLNFLSEHRDESGIIYCATRKQVDLLTDLLQARGWDVRPYHAGLDDNTRKHNQHAFIRDDIPIIVATVAFGMGINKPNVRFILHVDLPKDIESYYQQIGRAGRDSLQADCLLLFSRGDVGTINYFIQEMAPHEQKGASLRLGAMVQFAEAGVCRRQPLLHYFNEPYHADSCDLCDNCLADDDELVDITIPAQKFLSCVYRTGQTFGTLYIIDVLRGSQRKEILQRNHDQLSTYGIGADLSKKQWRHLATQFIQQELMTQDLQHGSLKLTEHASVVFRGEKQIWGVLEPEPLPQTSTSVVSPAYDTALFEILRRKRKEVADTANVPPYIIFSDRALAEMATFYPQSHASFAAMYGVGQTKLERYADEFIPLIHDYCLANNLKEQQKTAAATITTTPRQPGSRTFTIGEMYQNGRSLTDIAAQLNISPRTVVAHLLKYVQAGRPLSPDSLRQSSALSAAEQTRVLACFAEYGPDYLRPVYDALNETVSYDELHIMRLVYLGMEIK